MPSLSFKPLSVMIPSRKRHVACLGEGRISGIERLGIALPHIWWRHHAEQHHGNTALLEPCDHRVEVPGGGRGIEPAQGIICAELQQHAIGAVGNGPVQSRQPVRGRVAGDGTIGDRHIDTGLFQCGFELGRIGIARGQFIARHQAVAESHDLQRSGQGGTRPLKKTRQHKRKNDTRFKPHKINPNYGKPCA